jgi:parallel beta-helix repeat protein
MNRKIAVIAILVFLASSSGLALRVQTTWTDGKIYIRADGSIDPPTAPIHRDNDLYTLNDSVTPTADGIIVQRNDMTLDGAGHLIQGTGTGIGIDLTGKTNVTVKNTRISAFDYGIKLSSSTNNTITENTISTATFNGVELYLSSDNTVTRNNMTQCQYYGIGLDNSPNNSVSENNMTNNNGGLYFDWSSHNIVSGNSVIANSGNGIRLQDAENNTLRNNTIADNMYNFEVFGDRLSYVTHNIDTSNTVKGKPIYYLVNETDGTVPSDAGFIALVNCARMIVQNLSLSSNGKGIMIAFTKDSTIVNNNVTDNVWGIWLLESSGNWICGNRMRANSYYGIDMVYSSNNSIIANQAEASFIVGIRLFFSDGNSICGNNVTGNNRGIEVSGSYNSLFGNDIAANAEDGIFLSSSSNNDIAGNTIAGNGNGIELYGSSSNNFYNNNFMKNALHVNNHAPYNVNFWDAGSALGGNYWQGYFVTDLYKGVNQTEPGSDGVADISYIMDVNNSDDYPLMGPFSSFNTSLNHCVSVVSNSTIEDFRYSESNRTIQIRTSNLTMNQTTGFCRVCIPHALMDTSNISVTVDDGLTPLLYKDFALYDNGTHRWIYFAYEHSMHEIEIAPEFPVALMLPMLIIATLLVTALYWRRQVCVCGLRSSHE